jgi:phosphatidylglycerophosphatase A
MPHMHDHAGAQNTTLAGRLAIWIATGLGVGLVAPAPGTIAGLWGLPLVAAIARAPGGVYVQAVVIAVLLVLAAALCDLAVRALGSSGDPSSVALDEIVVLPIVFLGAPLLNWQVMLAGFLLFRIFDIWKPGLVTTAERLPGGFGIVADDIVAAALAWAALRGVFRLDDAYFHWFVA